MGMKIEIELRPCLVNLDKSDRKALFHSFISEDGCAIVEFEDGRCTTVPPWSVKFIDNKFSEYCFDNKE